MFRYGVFDLVHEAALRRALQDGRLAGAALDVLEDEESKINPFSDLPQVGCDAAQRRHHSNQYAACA